jgi:hypothetical protein
MSPEEKAATINARCSTALIRAMGMQAENQQRFYRNDPMAYVLKDFEQIIIEEGILWSQLHKILLDPF